MPGPGRLGSVVGGTCPTCHDPDPRGSAMAGGWMDKFKDYVKGNPEQAGSAIEKVEDLIDQRTGGKYADKVDQGGDVLRDKLGLPPQADQPADQPGAQPGTPPATPAGPGPVEQS